MAGLNESLKVEIELVDDQFTTKITRVGSTLKGLEAQILSTVSTTGRLDAAVQKSGQSLALWTIALGEAGHAIANIREMFGGWIERIVETNANIEKTTILLKGLSQAQGDAARAADAQAGVAGIMQMSAASPFSMNAITDTFVKMRTAGIDPLKGSMQSLVDAIAAFGGDDQRLTRAGYAIQEMAGRGVISLQNLRRQLGQDIPGAVELMARAMNVSVAELDQMVTKGTLNSKVALGLLLDEFDRTYGGAAVQRVNTFTGAVAQLSTQMTRLAISAGGMNAGTEAASSFYKTVVAGTQELTNYLRSNEVNAFAISVNNNLRAMTEAAMGFGREIIAWQGPLRTVIELLGGLAVYAGGRKIIEALASGVSGAFATIRSDALAVGQALNTGFAWLLDGAFEAKVVGGFEAASAAVTGFGRSMIAMTTGIAEAELVVGPLSAALAGLSVGLVAIAVPSAIIAGLTAITLKLVDLKGAAYEAGVALDRVRQGDLTKGNQDQAQAELDNLIAKAQRYRDAIDNLRKAQGGSITAQNRVDSIGGFFDEAGVGAPVRQSPGGIGIGAVEYDPSKADAAMKALQEQSAKLERQIRDRQDELAAVPAERAQHDAQIWVDSQIAALRAQYPRIEAEYIKQENDIEEARKKLNPADGAGIAALNDVQLKNIQREYDARENLIRQRLEQERQTLAGYGAVMNAEEIARSKQLIDRLSADLQAAQTADAAALARYKTGFEVDKGDKDYAAQLKSAQTLLETMRDRVAALNGEIEGTGSQLAKMNQMLAQGGKLGIVGQNDEVARGLREMAAAEDAAVAAHKRWQDATKADGKIDLGLDKANADLQHYADLLSNPNMTDGHRAFIAFQRQIAENLQTVTAQFSAAASGLGIYTNAMQVAADASQVMDAQIKAQQATERESLANALQDLAAMKTKAENESTRGLKPGERAQRQKQINTERANATIGQLQNAPDSAYLEQGLDPSKRLEYLAQARQALAKENAAADREASNALSRSASAGTNRVAAMAGDLARLKAELSGTGGELAKWTASLEISGKYSEAQRAAIKGTAAEIDLYTAALKKAHVAQQALETLKTHAGEASDRLAEAEALGARAKMLPIERQILDYRIQQNKEVAKVGTQIATPEHDKTAIAADVARAQSTADANTNAYGKASTLTSLDALRTQTAEITRSFATTLAARRQAGEQEIQQQAEVMRRLIDQYHLEGQERQTAEQTVDDWISAKREQLAKQTEDGLTKLMRQWADVSTQLENFGGQAFSKLTDSLTSMATTGKMSFSTLADWAIKELSRILMDQSIAKLGQLLGGSGPGGGWSGVLTQIGSAIGGMFGGVNPGMANTANTSGVLGPGGGASTGGPVYGLHDMDPVVMPHNHAGGIAGHSTSFRGAVSRGAMGAAGHFEHFHKEVFSRLRKFHTGGMLDGGLKSNEVPIVARTGEGVFTEDQLGAIGRMNHSYSAVESMMGQMVQAMHAVPANLSQGAYSTANGAYGPATPNVAGGGMGNVQVNMHNQSGTQMNAMAGQPRFDGEKMVMDIVLKNAQSPGQFRNLLKAPQ